MYLQLGSQKMGVPRLQNPYSKSEGMPQSYTIRAGHKSDKWPILSIKLLSTSINNPIIILYCHLTKSPYSNKHECIRLLFNNAPMLCYANTHASQANRLQTTKARQSSTSRKYNNVDSASSINYIPTTTDNTKIFITFKWKRETNQDNKEAIIRQLRSLK